MTSSPDIQLVEKAAVAKRIGVTERTLERLVKAGKFPPPLRLGKHVTWAHAAVENWLTQAVAAQLNWVPPARTRRTGRAG